MVGPDRIKSKKFKLPIIGSEITERDLKIAFVLLKRSQKILKIKCKHPQEPAVEFILDQIGRKSYIDQKKVKFNLRKEYKENNWCN